MRTLIWTNVVRKLHKGEFHALNIMLFYSHSVFTLNEPQREKTYLLICAPNNDTNQFAHLRSLIRVFVLPREETLYPWLSKIRPEKILIRRRICAGWSESSLDAHVSEYAFSDVAEDQTEAAEQVRRTEVWLCCHSARFLSRIKSLTALLFRLS